MNNEDFKYNTTHNGKYISILPINEITEMLRVKFEDLQKTIDRLKEENKKLKDTAYKDKELSAMKERLEKVQEEYSLGFSITKETIAKIKEWQTKHTETMHNAKTFEEKLRLEGVSGGRWSYEFLPTAIGTRGVCICNACKRKAYKEAYTYSGSYIEMRDKNEELMKLYDAEFEFQEID